MELTENKFARTVASLRQIAGEAGRVEFRDSRFWFFGSEAAVLRLIDAYRSSKTARQEPGNEATGYCFTLEVAGFNGEFSTTTSNSAIYLASTTTG